MFSPADMPAKELRTMNTKKRLTLRVSTMCFGIALGALVILAFVGVARIVHAQDSPSEEVLYSFTPASGYYPTGLINDSAGNLYVANQLGGNNQGCVDGCGNILKIGPSGKVTELYAFMPTPIKGAPGPIGAPFRDASGVLYGATVSGGRFSRGSLYKVSPTRVEKTLYNFDPATGGGYSPQGGVTMDSEGNLYGTTYYGGGTGCGGGGCGIIYKLTPSGSETILYSFTGGADGGESSSSPILDSEGNLYGTAAEGGDLSCALGEGEGCGTVWKLDTSGNFAVLYSFTGSADGAFPETGLVMDTSGNLYGTADEGGDLSCGFDGSGCGTVFEIDSAGNFTALHAFPGGSGDGQNPIDTLLRDSSGTLYGMTYAGGDLSCSQNEGTGCGVVFKLDASGNETIHILSREERPTERYLNLGPH
jgi:uncharacterized repeat protein (TIGR03803 family)